MGESSSIREKFVDGLGEDDVARVGVRFGVGEAVPAAGCGWSTDFVTESRTGMDDGAQTEVRFGVGEAVRAVGCGIQFPLFMSHITGNYFATAFAFFSGMAEINARKALFTSSEVVKTLATSGSTMTINGSFFIRDAKRFGLAFL